MSFGNLQKSGVYKAHREVARVPTGNAIFLAFDMLLNKRYLISITINSLLLYKELANHLKYVHLILYCSPLSDILCQTLLSNLAKS